VLNSELTLFEKIKVLHRQRQNDLYKLHIQREPLHKELVGGFSTRARFYLAGLLVLALAATVSHIYWDVPSLPLLKLNWCLITFGAKYSVLISLVSSPDLAISFDGLAHQRSCQFGDDILVKFKSGEKVLQTTID
jgi:hypothetical protein